MVDLFGNADANNEPQKNSDTKKVEKAPVIQNIAADVKVSDAGSGVKSPKLCRMIYQHERMLSKLYGSFVNRKLPHSVILNGSKGIGKTSFAFLLMKHILSVQQDQTHEDINEVKADNRVVNLIENDMHPDAFYIAGEDGKQIDIATAKKVSNFLGLKSAGNCKVVIIDSIDHINKTAANSLLKAIEEPHDTYFFLISHDKNNVLETIKSRSIVVDLDKINEDNCAKIIKQHIVNETEYNQYCILSSNNPGLLMYLYDINFYNIYCDILKFINGDRSIKAANVIQRLNTITLKLVMVRIFSIVLNDVNDITYNKLECEEQFFRNIKYNHDNFMKILQFNVYYITKHDKYETDFKSVALLTLNKLFNGKIL